MTLVAPELKEQGKARGDHEGRRRHYIKRTFQGSLAVTYRASKCFKKYKHEAIKEPYIGPQHKITIWYSEIALQELSSTIFQGV